MNSFDGSMSRALAALGFRLKSLNAVPLNDDSTMVVTYDLPLGLTIDGILIDAKNLHSDHAIKKARASIKKHTWCSFVLIITELEICDQSIYAEEKIWVVPWAQLTNLASKKYCDEIPLFNNASYYIKPSVMAKKLSLSYSDALLEIQRSPFTLVHGEAGVGKTRLLSEVTKNQPRIYVNIEQVNFSREARSVLKELVLRKLDHHPVSPPIIIFDALEQNSFVRGVGLNAFLSTIVDVANQNKWRIAVLMRTDWFNSQLISDLLSRMFEIFEVLPFDKFQQEEYISLNVGAHRALISNSDVFRIPLMLEFASSATHMNDLNNEYDIINSFYFATLEKKGVIARVNEYDAHIGKIALYQYLSSGKALIEDNRSVNAIERSVLVELGVIVRGDVFMPHFSHALIRDYFLSRYIKMNLDNWTVMPWLRPDTSIFDFPVFYFLRAQSEMDNALPMCVPIETDEIAKYFLTTKEEPGINFVCALYSYDTAVFYMLLQQICILHIDSVCKFQPAVIKFLLKYGAYFKGFTLYRLQCLQEHNDHEIRSLICECIGVANDRSYFEYIAREIESNGTPVAYWSIRKLRSPDKISLFIDYLLSSDDSKVATAIKALVAMQLSSDQINKVRLKEVPSSVCYFKDIILRFPTLSIEIVNMLDVCLQDINESDVQLACWNNERELLCVIEVISEVREPKYLPFLMEQYTKATSEHLRNSIIDAIGEIRSIASAEWLINNFENEESALVRGNILWALGNNPTITALAFLRAVGSQKSRILTKDEQKWLGWALSQHSFSVDSHMHVYP